MSSHSISSLNCMFIWIYSVLYSQPCRTKGSSLHGDTIFGHKATENQWREVFLLKRRGKEGVQEGRKGRRKAKSSAIPWRQNIVGFHKRTISRREVLHAWSNWPRLMAASHNAAMCPLKDNDWFSAFFSRGCGVRNGKSCYRCSIPSTKKSSYYTYQ